MTDNIKSTPPNQKTSNSLRANFGALRQYGIIFAFVAVFTILSTMTDAFATKRNMLNVLDQVSQIGLASLGATVTIIGGGFDLSLGSVYAASGSTAAIIAKAGYQNSDWQQVCSWVYYLGSPTA